MSHREAMGSAALAGRSGQIIHELIKPRALLRLLPFLLLVLCLGAAALMAATYLVPLPFAGQIVVILIFVSPVMGREALRARFHEEPTAVEVLAFAARFAVLVLLWGAPLTALWPWLGGRLDLPVGLPSSGGLLVSTAWPTVIAACLALGVVLLATQVTLIQATLADGFVEIFAPSRWWWIWHDGARQLPAVLATLMGGVALLCLAILPVVLLFATCLVRLNPYAGVITAALGYLLPPAAGCLLAARLGGAVASLRDEASNAEPEAPGAENIAPSAAAPIVPLFPTTRVKTNATPPASSPLGDFPGDAAMDLIQTIQSFQARADRDLDAAITEAEDLFTAYPGSAGVLAELAKLYRRGGRDDLATETAARAIALALNGGMSPVAVEAYRSFAAVREHLDLSAGSLAALSRALRFQGHEADADWCDGQVARLRRDPAALQYVAEDEDQEAQ